MHELKQNSISLLGFMENINKRIITNEAAKAALIFGAVSLLYMLLPFVLKETFVNGLILNILRIVKLVGLIWLMRALMIKLKNKFAGVGRKELVRYGSFIALFSAILVACGTYIYYNILFPDAITAMMDTLLEQIGPMMDSNSMEILESMEGSIDTFETISNLIYCFLYGWVLSLILAPKICPSDIFTEKNTPFEQ